MTLKTLFTIPILVILLSTLALAGMTAATELASIRGGAAAITAVERGRFVFETESKLAIERMASNAAMGSALPLPDAMVSRVADARGDTDRAIAALAKAFPASGLSAAWSPDELTGRLRLQRAEVDRLLAQGKAERSFGAISLAMMRGLEIGGLLKPVLALADANVIAAEPALSGIVAILRLSVPMREQLSEIAALWMPRQILGTPLSAEEAVRVNVLLEREALLTRLMGETIFVANATAPIEAAFREFAQAKEAGHPRLKQILAAAHDAIGDQPPQFLIPLGLKVNALRVAIMDETVRQVESAQAARWTRLSWVLTIIGVEVAVMLTSLSLVFWRLARQLAALGNAIRRIAAGDRSTPLVMRAVTRDLKEMVVAVETLRQAALVADASSMRQREAERRRLETLREALGIVQTVRDPARALENGIARLCEGIDAAIALVAPSSSVLTAAARAARLSLEEMRSSSAELEATIAAAHMAHAQEHPEGEIMAHIQAVQAQVERRDAAVRGLIQPGLVGLRDVMAEPGGAGLRDLVSDQFLRIEAAVAMVASMRESMARVERIVRDLPLEPAAIAA